MPRRLSIYFGSPGIARSGTRSWPSVAAIFLATCTLYGNPAEPPTPTPTPAATCRTPSETPKPTTSNRAPAGVLYLLEDTTVPLKNGLQGIAAGTQVRLVNDEGDNVDVVAGEFRFSVRKKQVTDDLDVVAALRKRAAASAAAEEARQRMQEAVLVKQQRDEIEFLRTHPLATPTPKSTPKK